MEGIKKLRSTSIESRSYVVIHLDPDQTTSDQGKSDAQDVIDRVDLPDGTERPVVLKLESKENPIIEIIC